MMYVNGIKLPTDILISITKGSNLASFDKLKCSFCYPCGLHAFTVKIPLRLHLPVVTADVGATEVGFVAGAWVPEEQQL